MGGALIITLYAIENIKLAIAIPIQYHMNSFKIQSP